MQQLTELKLNQKDKKVDIADRKKITKFGIHMLSGLNKNNAIIVRKSCYLLRKIYANI